MKQIFYVSFVYALLSLFGTAVATADLSPREALRCRSWKDEVLLYAVAPRYADPRTGESFRAITRRLPRIASDGFNTLWLQPVQATHDGGQGYDVTDYYEIWSDLGTEADLRELVREAHRNGLRVIFDFVANHTSVEHPYAKDIVANGRNSRYYDWYMHARDNAPYSWHYQTKKVGGIEFVYYFWDRLLNLNFSNPEVREHLIGAVEHWVKNFDIDGYRFDASWGPHSRSPRFFPEMKARLANLKPDLFLLAEDKAPAPEAYEGTEHPRPSDVFDAVYDWTASKDYVSEWAWQTDSVEQTIFNSLDEDERVEALHRVIAPTLHHSGDQARVMRFIENNDLPRFLWNHSQKEAKLAATLIFTLPGLPLVYYGQEAGIEEHYPSFTSLDARLKTTAGAGFISRYRSLLKARKERPELACGEFKRLNLAFAKESGAVFAFQRSYGNSKAFVFANLGSKPVKFRVKGDRSGKWIELRGFDSKIFFDSI